MEETNKGKKYGTTSEHNINTGKTFMPDNNKKKEKNMTIVDLLFENYIYIEAWMCKLYLVQKLG